MKDLRKKVKRMMQERFGYNEADIEDSSLGETLDFILEKIEKERQAWQKEKQELEKKIFKTTDNAEQMLFEYFDIQHKISQPCYYICKQIIENIRKNLIKEAKRE